MQTRSTALIATLVLLAGTLVVSAQESPNIRAQLLKKRELLLHSFNAVVAGEIPRLTRQMGHGAGQSDDVHCGGPMVGIIEELLEVDAALERIDDGDYGVCRRCGSQLDAGRLEANPEAQLCTRCTWEIMDE